MADGRSPFITWGRAGWKCASPAPMTTSKIQRAPFVVIISYEDGTHEIASCERLDEVADLRQRAMTGLTSIVSVDAFVRIT